MFLLAYIFTPYALLVLPFLWYLLPYLKAANLRQIPAPFPAQFSALWLMWHARHGKRYQAVDEAHKKYGKVVRIQPNHVSIADDKFIQTIYGHGNGFLKADYYDVFVAMRRGLFNTRDRAEHTRKRKIVSHVFSAKAVGQFEEYIHANMELFFQKWTDISKNRANKETKYASIDALNWFNYLAFDVIGDLAFGSSFGMLENERDSAEVRRSPESPPKYAPAIEILNKRGEVSGTLGCFPAIKPYARWLPDRFFRDGLEAVADLSGLAVAKVSYRLENPSDRQDLLAKLMAARDSNNKPMDRDELTAEALTQLIAGSDTTSNTSTAILYYIVRIPGVMEKLREELDNAIGAGVPEYEKVRDLPYLSNVISETMRIHSTSSLGLPRLVPMASPENPNPKNCDILGYSFPPGTVLSVPAYTIHHSKEIWGDDADDFVPERWDEGRLTQRQKDAFVPFSYGPRACVGRNVAEMELKITIATVIRNFDVRDEHQGPLRTREGFLRKPLGYHVGIRRRT